MSLSRSDFKPLPSTGIVPDDRVPADAFAVSYQFSYTATPNLDSFDASFSGKIVLHVFDSAGSIKYVITIEQKYNVFIFGVGGLYLYTWNQVPTAEKISGTIGENGPPMTTLGQGNFGVDPAEGSGTTNNEVIIDSRFYSGVFTEPLDEGDRIIIKFHNLSAGYVVARASLSLATELGASGEAILFDERIGDRLHVFIDKTATTPRVMCQRTRQMRGTLAKSQLQYGQGITVETDKLSDGANGLVEADSRLRGLQLLPLAGGAVLCTGATGGSPSQLRAFVSRDRGENWKRVMNQPLPIVPIGKPAVIAESKVLLYGTDDDKKPAYVIAEYGTDGFKVTKSGVCETTDGSELPTKGANLEAGAGGVVRLFARASDTGTLSAWVSRDEGAKWQLEQTT